MDIYEALDALQIKAKREPEIRDALLATKDDPKPLDAFCKVAQGLGYPIYVMDLVSCGEDFYASMRRSTNGGGENSPKLEGEDDFYELFMAAISR